MPLILIITYFIISYYLYNKNKDNINQIPFILKIHWIIAFTLLFIFQVYYIKEKIEINSNIFKFSYFFIILSYLGIFFYFLFKYKKKLLDYKKENNKWKIEKITDNIYFIIIFSLSTIFLFILYIKFNSWNNNYYSNYWIINTDLWLKSLFYLFFSFSSIYILLEKRLLKNKTN